MENNFLKDIKNNFSFFIERSKEKNIYLCSCGHVFENVLQKQKKTDGFISEPNEYIAEYSDLLVNINSILSHGDIRCPSCGKQMAALDVKGKLVKLEKKRTKPLFLDFDFKNDDNVAQIILNENFPIYKNLKNNLNIDFEKKSTWIKINKKTRQIFFKDFESRREREIDLDEIVESISVFFQQYKLPTFNLFAVHLFMEELGRLIIDTKNINITNELLAHIRNKINNPINEVAKRVFCVFLGIFKYSNLSTIAIIKGPVFLYDLMLACELPKTKTFIKQKVTSPIDIFNFLVQNYMDKMQKNINVDNKIKHEIIFKGKKIQIRNFSDLEKNNTNSLIRTEKGEYKIVETIKDKAVSKFLFNKISYFEQYKQLIKYLKFVDYPNLIDLLKRYDIEFLIKFIDIIYFRDGVDIKFIHKIIPIVQNYIEKRYNSEIELFNYSQNKYSFIKDFSFEEYDDVLRMFQFLKFDPRKDFDKIKTYDELIDFHDDVAKYFNALKDEEKNEKFREFIKNFLFLEERKEYDGPLQVKLMKSADTILREGREMKSCVGSYVSRVTNGSYVLAQLFDKDTKRDKEEPERYTIGFFYNPTDESLEFDQVKAACNKRGSDRFKKLVIEYLEKIGISYRMVADIKMEEELEEGF